MNTIMDQAFIHMDQSRRDTGRNQSHFWYMDQEVIVWIFLEKLTYIGRKAFSELLQNTEQHLNRTSLGG